MAYDRSTSERNRRNADMRPDGNGNLVHKDDLPKSKREKAREKLKNRRMSSKNARHS